MSTVHGAIAGDAGDDDEDDVDAMDADGYVFGASQDLL